MDRPLGRVCKPVKRTVSRLWDPHAACEFASSVSAPSCSSLPLDDAALEIPASTPPCSAWGRMELASWGSSHRMRKPGAHFALMSTHGRNHRLRVLFWHQGVSPCEGVTWVKIKLVFYPLQCVHFQIFSLDSHFTAKEEDCSNAHLPDRRTFPNKSIWLELWNFPNGIH